MKRIIPFLLLALLVAPGFLHAALVSGGAITGPLVDKDSTNGRLVLRTMPVDANGSVVTPSASLSNIGGAYLDVSSTSATGITTNAAVTRSLTFVAGTNSGILDLDLIGCAGMTTGYYKVHDGATPPAFFTANPSQGSVFLCGTTHIIEPRRFMGANPHITFYGYGLSATSGTFSFGLLSRTAQ